MEQSYARVQFSPRLHHRAAQLCFVPGAQRRDAGDRHVYSYLVSTAAVTISNNSTPQYDTSHGSWGNFFPLLLTISTNTFGHVLFCTPDYSAILTSALAGGIRGHQVLELCVSRRTKLSTQAKLVLLMQSALLKRWRRL